MKLNLLKKFKLDVKQFVCDFVPRKIVNKKADVMLLDPHLDVECLNLP